MLGMTQPALTKMVNAGMPHTVENGRKLFDEELVAAWLVMKGHAEEVREEPAEPIGLICTTRKEAAAALGVSVRYFSEWLNEPGFPGQSGSPGRQDGYFPIAEIEAWRASRPAAIAASQDPVKEIRAKLLTLEYERELKALIRADMYESFVVRTLAAFKAQLETFDEEIVAKLPPELDEKTCRNIQETIAALVKKTLTTLAELVEGDQDEIDDE